MIEEHSISPSSKKSSDKPGSTERQKVKKKKKKKMRKKKKKRRAEWKKRSRENAGLQREASLLICGTVSKEIPLNHVGTYRKEGHKGKRNIMKEEKQETGRGREEGI